MGSGGSQSKTVDWSLNRISNGMSLRAATSPGSAIKAPVASMTDRMADVTMPELQSSNGSKFCSKAGNDGQEAVARVAWVATNCVLDVGL